MVLWLKAFHIIMMVAWFAGLFYLPRLFVYHAQLAPNDESTYPLFCLMEKRLFWGIMTPSAVLTILLGIGTMHGLHLSFQALPLWLTFKLMLISGLIAYHFYCGILVSQFKQRKNKHSALFYRFYNEITLFILIGIVCLAVLKPF